VRCALFVGQDHWLGLDNVGGTGPGILSAAAGQTADGTDCHVTIAKDLATEPDAGQPSGCEDAFLGNRHLRGLAGHKFDPAGRTAGVTSTGVQLVDPGLSSSASTKRLFGGTSNSPTPSTVNFGIACSLVAGKLPGPRCPGPALLVSIQKTSGLRLRDDHQHTSMAGG